MRASLRSSTRRHSSLHLIKMVPGTERFHLDCPERIPSMQYQRVEGHEGPQRSCYRSLRQCAFTLIGFMMMSVVSSAQAPPRFYWKNLMGGEAVPILYQSVSGNSNPFDPAHTILPQSISVDSEFEAEMLITGYARAFPLFDRAALAAVSQNSADLETRYCFRSGRDRRNQTKERCLRYLCRSARCFRMHP